MNDPMMTPGAAGNLDTDVLHDWLTAWVVAHDAGDMTDDETLAVFAFIAELRDWADWAEKRA